LPALLAIIAVRFHRPDLSTGRVRDPLTVRRPAGRVVRFVAGRDLLEVGPIGSNRVDLSQRLILGLVDRADRKRDCPPVGRKLRIADTFGGDEVVDGKSGLGKCRGGENDAKQNCGQNSVH
jgi:hypothetical protein